MSTVAINSGLDLAAWFYHQCGADKHTLDNNKLQHLLFLAQIHYALTHNMNYLAPCIFSCDSAGFYDATLRHILHFGLPLMKKPEFAPQLTSFLQRIYKKYSPLNAEELQSIIKKTAIYQTSYIKDKITIVTTEKAAENFKPVENNSAPNQFKPKILISQNGPVMVSKWQPRKIGSSHSKEKTHA